MSPRGFKLQTPVWKAFQRLSNIIGTRPQSLSRAPSTDPSLFTAALPVDIIEEILLYLPGQDVVRMKQVGWAAAGREHLTDRLIRVSRFRSVGPSPN